MNSQLSVKRIKSVCIATCLKNGVQNPAIMRRIMKEAADAIHSSSVAGVKAAITKGQIVGGVDGW
jgi:hypothetical protein